MGRGMGGMFMRSLSCRLIWAAGAELVAAALPQCKNLKVLEYVGARNPGMTGSTLMAWDGASECALLATTGFLFAAFNPARSATMARARWRSHCRNARPCRRSSSCAHACRWRMHLGIPDRAAGREEGGCGTAAARDIHVGSLGNNGIDAVGMTALAAALPQCMALQTLSYTRPCLALLVEQRKGHAGHS